MSAPVGSFPPFNYLIWKPMTLKNTKKNWPYFGTYFKENILLINYSNYYRSSESFGFRNWLIDYNWSSAYRKFSCCLQRAILPKVLCRKVLHNLNIWICKHCNFGHTSLTFKPELLYCDLYSFITLFLETSFIEDINKHEC